MQGWSAEEILANSDSYESVTCLACTQLKGCRRIIAPTSRSLPSPPSSAGFAFQAASEKLCRRPLPPPCLGRPIAQGIKVFLKMFFAVAHRSEQIIESVFHGIKRRPVTNPAAIDRVPKFMKQPVNTLELSRCVCGHFSAPSPGARIYTVFFV